MDIASSLLRRGFRTAFSVVLATLITAFVLSSSSAQEMTSPGNSNFASPAWTKDLVIYGVATNVFTSPNGPGSGSFESLEAKLPYLQDLGITGIWLIGYSHSDPHHFFNIWEQYATIEPDKIDPSLGTPEQFKAMIDAAHRRGIRVFLDVTTHGVMAYSPLVKNHPEWFRGGSWGMIDYDWGGGHTDLDDWWVNTWTAYVTKYGVDGFRLDLGIALGNQNRTDLWARIRQNATAAGHPIVIFEEDGAVVPGVTDFSQGQNRISNPTKAGDLDPVLVSDIPAFYDRKFGRIGKYSVEVDYEDGSKIEGDTTGSGKLKVHLNGLTVDRVSARIGDLVFGIDPLQGDQVTARNVARADGIPDVQLAVENVEDKPIRNIIVSGDSWSWRDGSGPHWYLYDRSIMGSSHLAMEGQAPSIKLYIPTLDRGSSIALSAHDNGWWSGDGNPYAAQGSRALFGYSFLFVPRVPIFMSGEEFDATFHALPGLVDYPDVTKQIRILLGSMLDWSELDAPSHRSMLDDVRKMIALRRQESALLLPEVRGDVEPRLAAVPYSSDISVPVPYIRWSGNAAVIVVANRSSTSDAHLVLNIPVDKLGPTDGVRYKVTDLWNGGSPKIYSAKEMAAFVCTVKRDKISHGGIGLIKIESVH